MTHLPYTEHCPHCGMVHDTRYPHRCVLPLRTAIDALLASIDEALTGKDS